MKILLLLALAARVSDHRSPAPAATLARSFLASAFSPARQPGCSRSEHRSSATPFIIFYPPADPFRPELNRRKASPGGATVRCDAEYVSQPDMTVFQSCMRPQDYFSATPINHRLGIIREGLEVQVFNRCNRYAALVERKGSPGNRPTGRVPRAPVRLPTLGWRGSRVLRLGWAAGRPGPGTAMSFNFLLFRSGSPLPYSTLALPYCLADLVVTVALA